MHFGINKLNVMCTFCEWPPTQQEGGGDSFGVGPLNYNIYSLPGGAGNNGNHCQKKQLRFSQMGLGSCYKAALDSTIHCKVQFMQMARTDGTKYLDKEGLEYTMRQLMMIEIYVVCFSFQHQMSLVRDAGLFTQRVSAAPISGNIDNPEGGLDALMQVSNINILLGLSGAQGVTISVCHSVPLAEMFF